MRVARFFDLLRVLAFGRVDVVVHELLELTLEMLHLVGEFEVHGALPLGFFRFTCVGGDRRAIPPHPMARRVTRTP
jgi:hypothetical protein